MAFVEIERFSKVYASTRGSVVALDQIDILIREGEFISILGPSGCGKSTLLKCIAGLEDGTQGQIRIGGERLNGPPGQLGMVFQKDVLHVGAPQLGFMYAAIGFGALVGSLGAAYLSDYPRKGLVQIVSGVLFGVALAGFALSGVYWVSLVALAVVGLCSQTYMTINRVFVMTRTSPAYYGRVMAVYMRGGSGKLDRGDKWNRRLTMAR